MTSAIISNSARLKSEGPEVDDSYWTQVCKSDSRMDAEEGERDTPIDPATDQVIECPSSPTSKSSSPLTARTAPCGVVFERWVTPQDAAVDLLLVDLRAGRN